MCIHFEYSEVDRSLAEARALGRTNKTSPGSDLIQACITEDTLEAFYNRVYKPAKTLSEMLEGRPYLTGQVLYIHGKTPLRELHGRGISLPLEYLGVAEIIVDGMIEFYDIPIPTLITMVKVLSRWVDGHPRAALMFHTAQETYQAVKVGRASIVVRAEDGSHVRFFYT